MDKHLQSPAREVKSFEQRLTERGVEVSSEDKALMDFVYANYSEAKKFRGNYDKDWERWWKFYLGQQWDGPRPNWKSSPVLNYIFAAIETVIPLMTDSDPTITVAPAQPEDLQLAEIHSELQKRIWARNKMRSKLVKFVKNGLILGDGILKVWFNSEAEDGMGDVEYSLVDNRHFFPSPGALTVQDAAYIVFAANMPINLIEGMYPEAKGKIEPGVAEEELGGSRSFGAPGGSGYMSGPVAGTDGSSTLGNTSWAKTMAEGAQIDKGKVATLLEMWHRIDGDVWVTVFANGVKLKHARSPFRHNKYPFVKWSDYPISNSFWSMGDVQQLESPQKFINVRRGQTQDLLKICANPPFVADANSGINPKAMTSRPGIILYKNQGTEASWMQPPNIPGALFEVQRMDKGDIDSISGVYDVTKGKDPGQIEAAKAITALQDTAQTRIRLKVRNLEDALQELGEQSLALVQQFYTEKRVVRLMGGDPRQPRFITVNGQTVDKMGNPVKLNDVSVGKFDVEIGVGSTMPVDRTARAAELKELFQLGIVDGQAVLEGSTIPSSQTATILQRMQEAAMAAQGAMPEEGPQAAQAPPPPVSEEEIASLEAEQ